MEYVEGVIKMSAKPKSKIEMPRALQIALELRKEFNIVYLTNSNQFLFKEKGSRIYTRDMSKFNKKLNEKVQWIKGYSNIVNDVKRRLKLMCSSNEDIFSYDPWIVNFMNKVISVEKEGKTPKMFFYEIPHKYEGLEHDCPKFKEALKLWLGEDNPVTINDIFEIIGYCMTMNIGLKKAFYFYGPTDGGKTTFQTILEKVIGYKNRSTISLWRMNKDQFGTHGLQFKLINMVGDLGMTKSINNIEQFLQIAGGDLTIRAEPKGGNSYQFRNTVKLLYNSNNLPLLDISHKDTKRAFYNRFIIVNFPESIPKEKIITSFAEREILSNEEEIKGIIAESIRGLMRLYNRGYFDDRLTKNTDHEWQMNSDTLYRFLYEHTERDREGAIGTTEFLDRFNDYALEQNEAPESARTLPNRMKIHGYYKIKTASVHVYKGLKWKEEE